MYNLSGKVALVTGTSNKRGLGRGVALRMAREGADVIVNDKHRTLGDLEPWDKEEGWRGLDSLVAEIEAMGRRALAVTADVTNSREIDGMIAKAVSKFGKIDILVNNAALVGRDIGSACAVDMSEESWAKALSVDLTGVFLMCKAVANQMIRQGQGGKIVSLSSIAAKQPLPGRTAYSAAKAGVDAVTRAMALELAQYKINVNAVCPGIILTWGTRGKAIYEAIKRGVSEEEAVTKAYMDANYLQYIPWGRPARVEEVANVIAFLVSDQSDYITGQCINVDGGWVMAH